MHLQQALQLIQNNKVTSPTKVTSLDLRYNQIGDHGAGALAEALRTDTTITSLD